MKESDAVQHSTYPVTVQSLVEDFRHLGIQPGMVLLLHSSLSSLGWVCGAAPAVVLALEEALTPSGTLIMPTHTGDLSEPSYWVNPPVPESWWATIRETMPAFDPDLTPASRMGKIPECFRKQKGVLRSNHPQVSFAAWGKHAPEIIRDHQLESGLGDESPLGRIYALDGWVLLLGVDHNRNTSLHLAEWRSNYPSKCFIRQGAPQKIEKKRQWVVFSDLDGSSDDFIQAGETFEENSLSLKRSSVGLAAARLFRQRELVDMASQWFTKNRP